MTTFTVVPVRKRRLSGTLNPQDLQDALNKYTALGFRFVRSIEDRQRFLLFFSRSVHFLIFEHDE